MQFARQLLLEVKNPDGDSYRDRLTQTFPLGEVPGELRELAASLAKLFAQLENRLEKVRETLNGDLTEEDGVSADREVSESAELWFPVVGNLYDRALTNHALWHSYAIGNEAGKAPWARWLSFDKNDPEADIGISASPVLAAENLRENLWERCAGAVLTSATLSALGEFSMLKMRSGLPDAANFLSIPSPFRFCRGGQPGSAENGLRTERHAKPYRLHYPLPAPPAGAEGGRAHAVFKPRPDARCAGGAAGGMAQARALPGRLSKIRFVAQTPRAYRQRRRQRDFRVGEFRRRRRFARRTIAPMC